MCSALRSPGGGGNALTFVSTSIGFSHGSHWGSRENRRAGFNTTPRREHVPTDSGSGIYSQSGMCPIIASSSRKWGSIASLLDSYFHGNDNLTCGYFMTSCGKSYNHELDACPIVGSSSRKWGSIVGFLGSHYLGNDNVMFEHFAFSFEKGYVQTELLRSHP